MPKVVLFGHGGSGNHGCEALVRGLVRQFSLTRSDVLLSKAEDEDRPYGLDELLTVKKAAEMVDITLSYKIRAILSGDADRYYYRHLYRHLPELALGCDTALSIGGDNYCYSGLAREITVMRQILARAGLYTVLSGCSVDMSLLDRNTLQDLMRYDEICCRESLTYFAFQSAGFHNLDLRPDPAFALERNDLPLPDGFQPDNTVGINVSPLVIQRETREGMVLNNYANLIDTLLKETGMSIALIPHVVWSHNDDRRPLACLYDRFSESGRVVMIQDYDAASLKGYIARCRFMVAARTHASIAAYSTGVPTLVVGYSVKSRGLAIDLFGQDHGYVLPVAQMKSETDLAGAFRWLYRHEDAIRGRYMQTLPGYLSRLN